MMDTVRSSTGGGLRRLPFLLCMDAFRFGLWHHGMQRWTSCAVVSNIIQSRYLTLERICIQSRVPGFRRSCICNRFVMHIWCNTFASTINTTQHEKKTILNNPISRCGISKHHHEYRIHMLFAFVGSRTCASLCVHPVSLRCQSTMQYIVAAFRHRIYASSHSFPI